MTVSPKRHLVKTISYRIISTGIGFATMWAITDSVKIGAAFSFIELVWKPIQYYVHERVWYRYIKYGVTTIKTPIEQDFRIMESMTDEILETVTTTTPKRLVYTKKTE